MRTVFQQDPEVPFDEALHKIIPSAEGDKKDVSANSAASLQYPTTKRAETDLNRRLDEKGREPYRHEKWGCNR